MRKVIEFRCLLILAIAVWPCSVQAMQDNSEILSSPARVTIAQYPTSHQSPDPTVWTGTGWNVVHLEAITGQLDASSPLDAELINAADAAGLSPLHYAVAMGNLRPVQLLLDNGANVNASARGGFSVLHAACQFGDALMVQVLLQNGAEAHTLFRGDWLWLSDGVMADNPQVLREGMQMMLANEDWDAGMSCLHLAAASGNPELVELLLRQGLDAGLATLLNHVTPLHLCVASPACTSLLLAAGADPDPLEDFAGQTPLFGSTMENARLLLQAGADPDRLNSWGYGNLHTVESPAMATLLLDNGADIELRGSFGETPLMSAADRGLDSIAALLLERGADVNASDYVARTALDRAQETIHPQVAKLLEAAGGLEGFDLHPFHYTAAQGENELLSLALEAGEDVNGVDSCGWTALHFAAMNGLPATAQLLIDNGAIVDALDPGQCTPLSRCPLGPSALVQTLLNAGASPDALDPWFNTALLRACNRGEDAVASLLLSAGADPAATGPQGLSTLMYAAQGGNAILLRKLLDAGANLEARDEQGRTALLHALDYSVYYGDACTRLLLEAGADTSVQDAAGLSALHHLALRGTIQLASHLTDAGCPHSVLDSRGNSAARLARLAGNDLLATWLETLP
jgi:ankyrin repeat protein